MKTLKLFLVYFILGILFTFPLIFFLNSKIYGFPGDPFGTIYSIWQAKLGNFSLLPPQQPLLVLETKFLAHLFGEVAAYNLILLLSFPLAGLFTFLLVRYLTQNTLAAFLAGLIFAFSPYHLFQAYQHLGLVSIHWIPLYFLALFWTLKNPDFKKLIISALILLVATFENYYYGYFLVFSTLIFLIFFSGYYLLLERKNFLRKLSPFFLILIIFLVLASPILNLVFQNKSQLERQREEIDYYSTTTLEYFRPPIDHPLWGNQILEKAKFSLHRSNFFEQTVFLGFVPLLLALWGVYKNIRRKEIWLAPRSPTKPWRSGGGVGFWLTLGISAAILSSPSFKLADFLYSLLPMFRVYSRFAVIVMLSTSVLAGYGLLEILKDKAKFWKAAIVSILSLVILFEFLNFPPAQITDVSKAKDSYQWIKENLPSDSQIIEYPLVKDDEVLNSQYAFYQRFYPQKSLNLDQKKLPNSDRLSVSDPNSVQTLQKLKDLKITHLLLHKDIYREGRLPEVLWRYYDPSFEKYPAAWQGGEIPPIDNTHLKILTDQEDYAIYQILDNQ